ncbi:hypothetical protein SLA2020_233140 [Shorea laevis]
MAFASPYSLCLILLFLLPICVLAQTSQNIKLGSSLTAVLDKNDYWKSPSGDFAFGFQQMEAGMFLLAIWFDKIPEKTIIWSANGGNLVQQGSKIQLTTNGQFRLSDSQGKEAWVAELADPAIVSYAAMLNTGNFVLASQDSINLWESFNWPTDTIVPTQILRNGRKLVARYGQMNYSSARFAFVMQPEGNLVAFTTRFPLDSPYEIYWATNTAGSGFQVIFNQSGYIYLEAKNGSILSYIASNGSSSRDYYQRAILEYDGVFRYYVYPKNKSLTGGRSMGWSLLSYVPENICTSNLQYFGGAACGYNSYCILGNDQKPKCLCPRGYSYSDPYNDMNGCKRDFVSQECDGPGGQDADLFYIHEMVNTDWPLSDYEYFDSVTEDWCRNSCFADCYCAVAFSKNDKYCWKKKFPLRNGRFDAGLGGKSLFKIRKGNSTPTPPTECSGKCSKEKHKSTLILVLALLLGFSAFFIFVLLIATLWFVSVLRYRKTSMLQPSRATQGMSLQSFTYKELEEATNKFEEELGKGACSTVYKGILDIGNKTLLAVKRLDKMEKDRNEKEFQAEMSAIGKTNHKNLVRLLGFCNEGQHRLLVYEYMSNGSLASYLFGNPRPSWYRRTEIAFGTARGVAYLHEECSNQIIHCDIKPQNILLDDSFTARISDFGLAKLLKTDQTRTVTEVRGTRGYVAPEWLIGKKPVTVKVDVYSFGILLLELICCRRKVEQDLEDEKQRVLADWAYDCYEEGKLYLLVQEDEEAMEDIKRVDKFVMIAIWCIQDDPSLRPTMKTVSQMLEGTIEVPHPPVNPHSSV